jgi:iron uptake system component EfeO
MTYSHSGHGCPPTSNWLSYLLSCCCLLAVSTLTGCGNKSDAEINTGPPRTQIAVAITEQGCDVPKITTTAGKTNFTITNQASTPLEWEILDGVKVVEEVENILPGMKKDLKTTLDVGNYQMLCGKKTVKARSLLIVTAKP